MGNSESFLTPEKVQELEQRTHYTAQELKRMVVRYGSYDISVGGADGIPVKDILLIPDVCGCPVLSKIAAAHVSQETGRIHPEAFIIMFSALSSKATTEEKYQLLFDSLDVYNEGSVGFDQLFSLYKSLVSPALPDSHITAILVKVLQRESLQQQGKITLGEFKQLISPSEVQEKMTVDLQNVSS